MKAETSLESAVKSALKARFTVSKSLSKVCFSGVFPLFFFSKTQFFQDLPY
jgi:hypothetical protein